MWNVMTQTWFIVAFAIMTFAVKRQEKNATGFLLQFSNQSLLFFFFSPPQHAGCQWLLTVYFATEK